MEWSLKFSDLAIVVATLFGPVLAVQAQKWIERTRDRTQRQTWIFRTLMATRAAALSQGHVEALNAIPIEYYGISKIVDSWKAYIDYLYQTQIDPSIWEQRRQDLFIDLLINMADFLRYKFNRVELGREVYSPRAHAKLENDQEIIRQGLAKIFRGEMAFPMDVKGFPTDAAFTKNQLDIQEGLLEWLAGQRSLKVTVDDKPR